MVSVPKQRYRPRLTGEQAEEIRSRYRRGATVDELATLYDRGYDSIRNLVKGRSYTEPKHAKTRTCTGCEQADAAADNVIRSREFRGDAKCIECGRLIETTASIVRARQGRLRCTKCKEGKS
ncbi:hypothetical protein [Nocardia brasiliensis]|uniref:hypothetical protein n=1 Tax=Nocardia brasiliensis TaxID=37326 RepID=UPI002457AE3A|nr:hypothetical protein [Nocardia brasiliensis]